MAIKAIRTDTALPGAFLRQLEYMEDEAQREEFGELKFSDGAVVPLDIQNLPGIRTTAYRQITATGRFKLHRNYSTNIPMVNLLSREYTQEIHKWAGGYYITDDDVAASALTGISLEQEDITAVREVAMQELNFLIATGAPELRMPGILNHPDVLRSFSPVPFNASATSNQILDVIHDAATSMVTLTKRIEQPDSVFLPPRQYDYVATRRLDNTLESSIMTQALGSSPYIRNAEPLLECEGAGPNGEDVMLVMRRNKRKLKAMVIEDFRFIDLQRQGLGYQRAAFFRYAGIRIYRPYSIHLVIGI